MRTPLSVTTQTGSGARDDLNWYHVIRGCDVVSSVFQLRGQGRRLSAGPITEYLPAFSTPHRLIIEDLGCEKCPRQFW